MEPVFHVSVPYTMLRDYLKLIKWVELSPEIYLSANTLDQFDFDHYRQTAEMVNDAGLKTTVHAPFMDLCPGSPDQLIRELSVKRITMAIEVAALFSPRAMVCHPGYNDLCMLEYRDKWLEASEASWKKIADFAREHNVKLAFENIFEKEPGTLVTLLKQVDSPYFGACFDIGHYNIFADYRLDEWIEEIAPYLVEMHLHDNLGVTDNHWPPGKGTCPFTQLFTEIKKRDLSPILTLEVHQEDAIVDGVLYMKNLLEEYKD